MQKGHPGPIRDPVVDASSRQALESTSMPLPVAGSAQRD